MNQLAMTPSCKALTAAIGGYLLYWRQQRIKCDTHDEDAWSDNIKLNSNLNNGDDVYQTMTTGLIVIQTKLKSGC